MEPVATMFLHHGGYFKRYGNGNMEYVHGQFFVWKDYDCGYLNKMIIENKLKSVGKYSRIGNIWLLVPNKGGYVELLEGEDIHDMCTTAIRHNYDVHIYAEHPIDEPIMSAEVIDEEEGVNVNQANVNVAVGDENLKVDQEVIVAVGDENLKVVEEVNVTEADENLKETEEVNVTEDERNLKEAEDVNVTEDDGNLKEAEDVNYDGNLKEAEDVNVTDNVNEDESSEDSDYWPSLLVSDDDESFMDVECDLNEIERDEPESSRRRRRQNEGIRIELDQNVDQDEVVGDNDSYHSEDPKTPVSGDDEFDSIRQIFPQFDANAQFGQVHLELGMEFETLKVFKKAVREYNIYHMREIKWKKNDKVRCRAACTAENCHWEIFCSWNKLTNSFQVKTYKSNHDCPRGFVNSQAKTEWVASKLEEKIKIQPKITCLEAYEYIKRDFGVQINETKLFRALKQAREKVEGNYKEQYGLIWDYVNELRRSNDGTTTKINVTPVLEENKDNWKWFLTLLHEDLGDYRQHGWNFMSDMQKGLIPALQEVMPGAHHRFCVMHLWKNFTKQWKDKELKGAVWQAARSTTPAQFDAVMERIKRKSQKAWEYLNKWPKDAWTKAYFSTEPKVDNITNNTCEGFNSSILKYRGKPILTMAEEIRCYIMRTMSTNRLKLANRTGILCPMQQSRLEKLKIKSNLWTPLWSGDGRFQVSNNNWITHVDVDIYAQTCTCRNWQLTGIPCEHGIAALAWKCEKPEDFCRGWLTMGSYNATYEHFVRPTQGMEYWEKTDFVKPVPAAIRRRPGRPKKQRRKDASQEGPSNSKKMKRSYPIITCSRCGLEGHNINGCVSQGVSPKPRGWVPPPPPPPPASNVVQENQVEIDLSQSHPQTQEIPAVDMVVQGPQPMGFGQATFDPTPAGIRPPPIRGQNPTTTFRGQNHTTTEEQMLMSFMPTPRFIPRCPRP
ncbi:hypothetical protein QL285_047593 [Trifolium repens]|nr:hypothetical protein QL285_047593 [Trifolium repens]